MGARGGSSTGSASGTAGGPHWSFIDGPKTANNADGLGVHHLWGRTLKDVFQRYKALQGFDQRYQNGFDCQGLWVEVKVERDLGLNSKREIEEYGLDGFDERCRELVAESAEIITQQSIRLGHVDGLGQRLLHLQRHEHRVHLALPEGRCTSGARCTRVTAPTEWCPRCGTSLSQHELSHSDVYRDKSTRRSSSAFRSRDAT